MNDALQQGEVSELRSRIQNSDEPLLSICCTTYQHVNFIRDAIEGFVSQRTNFPVEIIIRDDASTDGTAQIVAEYAARYPAIIRPILNKKNMFRQGVRPMLDCLSYARGKYIAMCEGDDYWTDLLKLQKQVNFLENNPEYVLVGGYAKRAYQSENFSILHDSPPYSNDFDFDTRFLFSRNPIATLTACFKNRLIEVFPDIYFKSTGGDRRLYMLLSQYGKARYMHSAFGVYRIHTGGVTYQFRHDRKGMIKRLKEGLANAHNWNTFFGGRYTDEYLKIENRTSLKLMKIYFWNGNIANAARSAAKTRIGTLPFGYDVISVILLTLFYRIAVRK